MNENSINSSLFSLLPIPSWIYDDETLDILDVNVAAIEHYGYSREEFLTLNLKDLGPPHEVSKQISSHTDLKKREGNIYFGIFSHQKKNGTPIQMEINGHKVDFNDRPCMLLVCKDVTEKIEHLAQNHQSEQRFKALVQEGSELIAITDLAGNYKYVSPTSTAMTGIPPEDFIGKKALSFVHPDDVEHVQISFQKITPGNTLKLQPYRIQNHEKEWRWMETVMTDMLENPAVNGIVSNSRDITEKVNALKRIEANELFNRTVLESSPDCLKVLDSEGRLQFMNFNGLCQMEIDDFSEFKNKNWWTLWGAENEDLVKEAISKALKGENATFTAFCPTAKGTPKWWDVMVSPVVIAGEPIQQLISVSRDITALKKEEQRLKLLESVITNANDAVLITEAEPFGEPGPRIIYVNEAFTKMTGYTAVEVLGKTPRILQGPNSDKAELARLGKAIRNWEPCEITTINYKKNGDEFWINMSISPVADAKGWFSHWIAIERDVTEQKQKELEKELLGKISLNFSFENNLLDAATALCKTINKYGRFDFVELWLPTLDNTHIQLFAHESASPKADTFYEWSKDINSFAKGEGLPGIVWDKKATLLWNEISKKDDFVRKVAAQKAGIESAMGIPLIYNEKIVGVLVVGTQRELQYLKQYKDLFEHLRQFLGSEINRKKLEKDLQHLYDAIPDIICITDLQGRFLKINKAGCDLIGCTEEDILYNTFEKFVHPNDKESSRNDLKKLKKGGKTFGFENRYINQSGDVIWLSWTSNSNLQEGLIYATARNITEEKRLRELNRQTRMLAKVGGWEYDKIENKLFWSEEVHLLHETNPNTFVPNVDRAIDFYKEEHKSFVADVIHESLINGVYLDYEAVIISQSKKERWIRVIASPEYMDGKCVKFIGSFQDITERKEAEARLQSLSDNLPGVVFQYLLYPDGTDSLRYVSKGAEKIFGYSPEAVEKNIDLVWDQIKVAGDFEAVKQSVKNAIEKKSKWYIRCRTVSSDGEKRILQGLGTPEFLPDGTVLFNSVVLDVTQEAKNEQLLAQATEIAKIGSWEVDLANSTAFWSDMTHQIHETDPGSYFPNLKDGVDFFREDFRPMINTLIEKSISTGQTFDLEAVLVTANKNEKWIRAIGNAEMVDGKCQRLYGSFQDIHERKESELRLKSISDDLPGVTFQYIITPEGKDYLQGVSKAACDIWNVSPEDCEQHNDLVWNQIRNGGDFDAVQQSIQESIAENKAWNLRWRNILPNGEVRWHEGYGTPNRLADGTIVFNSLIFDITDKHKAVELYDEASKMAKIGGWEVNFAKNEILWSEMVHHLHETDSKTFKPYLEGSINFYRDDFKELVRENVEKCVTSGIPFDFEAVIITAKKHERWIRAIGNAEMVNGKCHRIYGSFQDINLPKSFELQNREILESISDAFYGLDKNWNIIYFNKEAENLLKRKSEDVLGKNIWQEFSPAKGTLIEKKYRNVAKTGKSETFEYWYPGDDRWYEINAYPSKGGVSAFFKNIDDRIKTAEDLQKAYEEKNNILESIGDAFFALDKNWIVTYWNKEAETVLGRKRAEIVGENLWEKYADAVDSDFYRQYHNAMETSEVVNFEEHYPTLSKWFEVTVYPSTEGLSIYFKDITLRKEADIRLLQANERFEKVTQATSDAIWDWDIANDTLYRSQNIQKFFGNATSKQLSSKDFWSDSFRPDDVEEINKSLYAALNDPNENRWESEYRIDNESGNVVNVIDKGLIIRDTGGKAIRMIGAMSDITKSKRQEKELISLNISLQSYAKDLERSNEELESFAFITSHDLQEPLRMISSFMDQLKRKYGNQLDEKALQYIHYAMDGSKRMKQIILDLLEYSRAGRPTELIENVDVNEIFSDYKQLRRKAIKEKKVAIFALELPTITSYKAAITQILHSLLDNAIKYSKNGIAPYIEINAAENKEEWKFSVKDNGIGINPEFFDKIFIIFQRLHNRHEYEGTGIGLSIAKKHVEFLGGKIWLESTLGEGTTFYFTIPKIS